MTKQDAVAKESAAKDFPAVLNHSIDFFFKASSSKAGPTPPDGPTPPPFPDPFVGGIYHFSGIYHGSSPALMWRVAGDSVSPRLLRFLQCHQVPDLSPLSALAVLILRLRGWNIHCLAVD